MGESEWGRRETAIWPPHQPVFTWGWFVVTLGVTGFFLWLAFAQAFTAFQQFYLPVYLKTTLAETFRPTGKYRILLMADARKHIFYARDQDVTQGSTPQWNARPLPLALSDSARGAGITYIFRSALTTYNNRSLHHWLKARVYDGDNPFSIFKWPVLGGALVFILPLPYWIVRDIRRRKQMKYGRLLRGPALVSARGFNRAVEGDGVGFNVCWHKQPMRIPKAAEDHHIEIIGDTGSGKTTLIMQLLRQVQERGHPAIVYDPACEFIQRFYNAERGDIVLNPLDRRCPYWGPSEELVRRSEARTLAASLFQHPDERTKHEFFIETPQKIFAKLLLEAGRPFEQLQQAGMRTAKLDEIVRQKDPALKSAVEMLARGQSAAAIIELRRQGRVKEIPGREERIRVVARAYAESPDRTLIVSPDNASRRELNTAVRNELRANGSVTGQDHPLRVLFQRQDMTGADRAWANHYETGDVVRYSRGSKAAGIEASSYATVTAIDPPQNLLTVQKESGESISYDPRRLTGVSVYRENILDFAVGDRIQFTAPEKQLGVANRDLAVIESIGPDGRISARLDGNRQIEFNPAEYRHFDHGYAVTSHSAQGLTAERVLIHADTSVHPDLLSSRFGYVAVSRASHEATIFTDDVNRLGQQLSTEVSKSSALEIQQTESLGQGMSI